MKMVLFKPVVSLFSFEGGCSAVVYSLFVVAPIVCGDSVLVLCFVVRYFMSILVLKSS